MHHYRLEMDDDGFGHANAVEFNGEDAGNVIYLMSRVKPGRRAHLWEGDRFLCSLSQHEGVWRVAGVK